MSDLYGTGAANQPDTHSGFNDSTPPNGGFAPWGRDGNVYPANADFVLGVDLATLVDLPQDLRGRTIGALQALANARSLGNKQAEDTAAATLAEIVQEIQRVKNEATATKAFSGRSLHKATNMDGVGAFFKGVSPGPSTTHEHRNAERSARAKADNHRAQARAADEANDPSLAADHRKAARMMDRAADAHAGAARHLVDGKDAEYVGAAQRAADAAQEFEAFLHETAGLQ